MKRALWPAVWFLSFIGVAVVIRRMVAILVPSTSGPGLDDGFAQHSMLTMIHIVPGLAFMILGPFQFMKGLRSRRPRLHRWMGRVFVVCGLIIGGSAMIMSPQMSIGGVSESTATMFFGLAFLFCLAKAFLYIRRRNVVLHREWMIRAYAIGLAVATIRPIVGVFFATQRLTHLTPHDFFGAAFWLGFTAQTLAAEAYIQSTRFRRQTSPAHVPR